MNNSNAQHLNGFFSKNMDIPVELLDRDIQIKKRHKYVFELEHSSLTMEGTRTGKHESSIERDRKKPTRKKFFSDLETVRSVLAKDLTSQPQLRGRAKQKSQKNKRKAQSKKRKNTFFSFRK